jgi:hypothetical protein
MRLLLDTNTLIGENYQKLKKVLAQNSNFIVLGNSVALNELLYISPYSNLNQFKHEEPIKNFLELVNDRWFRQMNAIVGMELAKTKYKYWFESCADKKDIEKKLVKIVQSQDISHLNLTKPDVEKAIMASEHFEKLQKKFFRKPANVEQGIFDYRGALLKNGITDFQDFWNSEKSTPLKQSWENGIFNGSWLDAYHKKIISLSEFESDRDQYSYFNLLIKGFVFICFDSAVGENGQQRRWDNGCQLDMFQVVMMKDADILVSEETRFIARCFRALWANDLSKRICTIDEFKSLYE